MAKQHESVKTAVIKGCDSLQWFEENCPEMVSVEALVKDRVLDEVIFWGNAGVLRWLAANRSEVVAPEKCQAEAETYLYWAAQSGNAEVFAWLYERIELRINRYYLSEWTTTAAARGHIAILEYLQTNKITDARSYQTDYCATLRAALGNGQIVAANWMEKNGYATTSNCKAAATSVQYYGADGMHWIFDRVPRSAFGYEKKLWRGVAHRRQQIVLVLLLSSRRQRLPRIPPEVWEQCVAPLVCGDPT